MAGMDVARLNMSHGTWEEHEGRIEQVRRRAEELGLHVAVLIDLPGPKFRLGSLPQGSRQLDRGAQVILAASADRETALPVAQPEILRELRPGEAVYLSDGAVKLAVRSRTDRGVICEVLHGGIVRSGTGINFPDSRLSAKVPTEDDRRHIARAVAWQAEWLGVSFVQSADDLTRVRTLLPAENRPLLVAKIEKKQALADLDAIMSAADGVMVARGDLGVETDLAQIPLVQKRIIALANARARPVITATQMLESMVEHEQPTRAEVTDIANAVLDGTDAVMLSAETAIGKHPVAAAEILGRVLAGTEKEYGRSMMVRKLHADEPDPAHDSLSVAACELAARLDARAIIAPVRTLEAATRIAAFRPEALIVAVTDSEPLCRRLAPVWGVSPLLVPEALEPGELLARAFRWLLQNGSARPGDPAIVLSASGRDKQGPDTLRVVHMGENA